MQNKMHLYDLTKQYGKGKGEGMMWSTVEIISEAVEHSMPEEEKHHLMREIFAMMNGGHYDDMFAREDVAKMYYTDNRGVKYDAPYWTDSDIRAVYDSVRGDIQNYNYWDFYVALNMIKSDNCALLSKWFPDQTPEQRDTKLVEMTINWLNDPDYSHPDAKIWYYLN